MSIWNNVRGTAANMQAGMIAKKNDLKSGSFRDGAMAMCALVAAADGSVDAEERRKVAGLIQANEVLQNFKADDMLAIFNANCDKLTADFDFGKVSVLQTIGHLKKKPAEARAVVQIGIIIGGADGNFDDDEKQVVKEACFAVGLPPAEFDL